MRAYASNPYVLSDVKLINDMEQGRYVVRPDDLPIYEIYQCTMRWTDLCIRPLSARESTGEKTAASLINLSW